MKFKSCHSYHQKTNKGILPVVWIILLSTIYILDISIVMADDKYKLGGRLFLDGGVFISSPERFRPNVNIPDLRLTGKADFGKGWYTKLDVGFAGNKIKLKDAFLQKTNNEHMIRAGYMIGMFSLDQSSSTNDYLFMTGANVAETFYPDRRIGISYTYSNKKLYFSGGVFCGDDINLTQEIKPETNVTLRIAYRPINDSHTLFHIGTGGLYKHPNTNTKTGEQTIHLSSKGCTYLPVPDVFDATITNSKVQYQWNIETILYHYRFFMQGEIMGMLIKRKDIPHYNAHGGYIEGGYFICGKKLGYDQRDALPTCTDDANSIAIFARVNRTNLNDSNLKNGTLTDFSIGLNWYINEHIIFRLNYSNIKTDLYAKIPESTYNLLQSRIQVKF